MWGTRAANAFTEITMFNKKANVITKINIFKQKARTPLLKSISLKQQMRMSLLKSSYSNKKRECPYSNHYLQTKNANALT
jgi:hypothetical protein